MSEQIFEAFSLAAQAAGPKRRREALLDVTAHGSEDRNRRIGALLRERRRELGLSLEWVGGHAAISTQLLSSYERGEIKIFAQVIWKLAKVLGANIDDFFVD